MPIKELLKHWIVFLHNTSKLAICMTMTDIPNRLHQIPFFISKVKFTLLLSIYGTIFQYINNHSFETYLMYLWYYIFRECWWLLKCLFKTADYCSTLRYALRATIFLLAFPVNKHLFKLEKDNVISHNTDIIQKQSSRDVL